MTADEFARDNGFISVKPMPDWRGYKCFEAILAEPQDVNDIQYVGFPQIVLEKDGECRFADYDEAMAIIDALPEDEDE